MINFEAYGQSATAELIKQNESITCACCEGHYLAVGTTGGCVHILDLTTKLVTLLGPYDTVKHVAALHNTVAIATTRELIVFDREEEDETIRTSIANLELVNICGKNGPKTGIICGRTNEILAVNKGWVRVSVSPLPIKVNGLKDLKVHFSLLCTIDTNALRIHNLGTNELVWSYPLLLCNQLLMYWLSPSNLAIVADDSLQVLEYKQGRSLEMTKSLTLPSIPTELGQFNEKYLVYLDSKRLYILDIDKNESESAEPPMTGILLTPNKLNSPLYIVTGNRFFKVTPQTIKEQISFLLKQNKVQEAMTLSSKCNVQFDRVLGEHIEYLIAQLKTEDLQSILAQLALPTKLWDKVVDYFLDCNAVHMIVKEIPPSKAYSYPVLRQLIVKGQEEQVRVLIQTWPSEFFLDPETQALFTDYNMPQELIALHQCRGDSTSAFVVALENSSEDTFDMLQAQPQLVEFLVAHKQYLGKLFEINPGKASALAIDHRDKIHCSEVIQNVREDLIVRYIKSIMELERSAELENEMFSILLRADPSELAEFLKTATFLNLQEALRKAKKQNHLEAQFLIYRKLENLEEAKSVLERNFEVRLKYLWMFPELWNSTFAQAMDDKDKVPKVIAALKQHPNPATFVMTAPIDNAETEVKELLNSVKSHTQVCRAAAEAFNSEISGVFRQLHLQANRPIKVMKPFICCVCVQGLSGMIFVRKCGHHSHEKCSSSCRFCKDIIY